MKALLQGTRQQICWCLWAFFFVNLFVYRLLSLLTVFPRWHRCRDAWFLHPDVPFGSHRKVPSVAKMHLLLPGCTSSGAPGRLGLAKAFKNYAKYSEEGKTAILLTGVSPLILPPCTMSVIYVVG